MFDHASIVLLLTALAGLGLLAAALLRQARQRKDQVRASLHHMESTLNALPDAVIQIDAAGRPRYLNPSAGALLGIATDAPPPPREHAWQLLEHDSRQTILPRLLEQAAKTGLTRIPANARLINQHGLELEVEGNCQPLRNCDGALDGFLLQLRDVTEEREWRRQQPDLWDRDPVSNLPGRCFMENRLGRALQNRRTADLPLCYLYVAVSGIRATYDQANGLAGDSLVRHLTALLRAHVRDTDLVARMGQECFAILLTACPADIGRRIAAGLRDDLARFRFDWDGRRFPVDAVVGEVTMPPFDGSLDDLLAAARPTRPGPVSLAVQGG